MIAFTFAILSTLAIAVTPPPQKLDFEGVEVEGSTPKPNIQLVEDVVRDICPQDDDITDPGWAECVVNLSYGEIKNMCQKLGPATPGAVAELMKSAHRFDGYHNDVTGEQMHWRGCFYNSRSGPRAEDFIWHGTGRGWLLTDTPSHYRRIEADRQPSLTVFDGLSSPAKFTTDNKRVSLPATFAYRLQRGQAGSWTAVPSTTNQDEINNVMKAIGFDPVFCGSERLDSRTEHQCTVLPRLAVVALSPTMLAVTSYLPKKSGYQVTGIFWRSETGFDIASDSTHTGDSP